MNDEGRAYIRLYEIPSGRLIKNIPNGLSDGCDGENPAVFANGDRVIISGAGTKFGWNAATGRRIFKIPSPLDGHYTSPVSVSPDGEQFVVGFMDGTIKRYKSATGKLLVTLQTNAYYIEFVAYSSDGQRIFSCSDSEHPYFAVDILSGETVFKSDTPCYGLEASSKDNLVAFTEMGDDTKLVVLNVASGEVVSSLVGDYWTEGFTPNGKYLFVNDENHRRLMNVKTGKFEYNFATFSDGEWVFYSDDGRFDASTGAKWHISKALGNEEAEQYWKNFHQPGLFYKTVSEVQ